MLKVLGMGFILLGSFFAASSASACPFGMKKFACCQTSNFVGGPETRLLGGCALSKATAFSRCVATGFPRSSLSFHWDKDKCKSGSPSVNRQPTHHACSIAKRGSRSFTFYAYGSKRSFSKSAICKKAHRFNNTGRESTHYWYTTYWPNRMHKAIADCQNGRWVAYDVGIKSLQKVNRIRKQHSGKGCLFKIDKSWRAN